MVLASLSRPLQFAESPQKQCDRSPAVAYVGNAGRKLAYLTSQYPKVSHTFIRREMLALEKRGWEILRMAIRGWDAELVDADDIAERDRTVFALEGGVLPLLAATFGRMTESPLRFLSALALAVKMMRGSDRPCVWHLVYLAEACRLAPHLRARQITHVHVHFGTNPADVAMLLQKFMGVSYSITVHGPEEFDRARAIHLQEKIRLAKFVVAVSSFGRSQIFRLIEEDHWNKIKVVHCGVDRAYSAPAAVVSSQANRFVCVGRLCEQKGQLLLVRAAANLMREGREFRLILVGDGEHRGAIEGLIAQYGLSSRIEITGWADANRVKEEIIAARALVLPSFAEGLPIVLIEAMLLGRPVLTTYVAGIPELVIDGKAGWLFPAGSEEHLVEAMRTCLDTPCKVLRAMGEFARQRAQERHDLDGQANTLSRMFANVLQRGTA
ncbi:MAG: glycosyltransferase [Alphaproteobacteria bacterium]|nr:glycosyltransferase [Alphaproteobacteria bacterium]MDE2496154.1 glycosyltransferase [Alphaproteobacteria bacterium]